MTDETKKSEKHLEERLELKASLKTIRTIFSQDRFYAKPQPPEDLKTVHGFLKKAADYCSKIAAENHTNLYQVPLSHCTVFLKTLQNIESSHRGDPSKIVDATTLITQRPPLPAIPLKQHFLIHLDHALTLLLSLGPREYLSLRKKSKTQIEEEVTQSEVLLAEMKADQLQNPDLQQQISDLEEDHEYLLALKKLTSKKYSAFGGLIKKIYEISPQLKKLDPDWHFLHDGKVDSKGYLQSKHMAIKTPKDRTWVETRIAEIKQHLKLEDSEISSVEKSHKSKNFVAIRIHNPEKISARLSAAAETKQTTALAEVTTGDSKAQQSSIAGAQTSNTGSKTDSEDPLITQLQDKIKAVCPKLNSNSNYKWVFKKEGDGKEFLEGAAMNVSATKHKKWFDARVVELKQHLTLQDDELSVITKPNGFLFIRINDPKKLSARLFAASEAKQTPESSAEDSKSQESRLASEQRQQNSNNPHRFLSGATSTHAGAVAQAATAQTSRAGAQPMKKA